MDGDNSIASIGVVAVVTLASSMGCSGLDPKPEPVPFSLYDSPLIASGVPTTDVASSTDSRPTPEDSETSPDDADRDRAEASQPTEPATESSSEEPEGSKPPPTLASRTEADESTGTSRDAADAHDQTTAGSTSESNSTRDPSYNANAARYVTAIYELNGVSMPTATHRNIPRLFRHCRESGATFQSRPPAAGDLAFFHNVADANDDGRNNDWYTFVALVERVESDGRVQLLGYRSGSVQSFTMHLDQPDAAKRGGRVVNSELRPERDGEPPYTQHLAGQLFAGYCSLLGDKSELLVVDNWEPGMELEKP